MTPQRRILPEVMDDILLHHPDCSVILIGGVARSEERPDSSDLDLNLFIDEHTESPWVRADNRWQLQKIRVMGGVTIDVAWETFGFLETHLETDGPFWILSFGEIVRDPSGRVEPCLRRARKWAAEHPDVCATMEAQYREGKARQLARYRERDDAG